MAENEERPFQRSDLDGTATRIRRFIIPNNSTTTPESYLCSYLAENVLENILCFLTSIEDRKAASLVCKSWYRAEGVTRLDINIFNCYAVSPGRVINRFGGRVTSVTIKGLLGWLSSLEDCGAHFSPWVNSMSEAYRWLEKVYLKGMSVSTDDLGTLARSFPDLKELVLDRCEGFGARGLGIVASGCRQIRVFELIESEIDSGYEEDWISCFPESSTCLESFIFDCVYFLINFEALEQLVTRSPSLKKLRLSSDVSIRLLHHLIVRAPQLTHLGTGRFGPEVLVEGQDYAAFAAAFAACKSLVCLSGFTDIVPDYLRAIVPVCGNLISLEFQRANINAEELKSVICHCHKLQTLWLLDSVGDDGLKAVAATCKDLREFRLREEDEGLVSEVGLLAISEGCQKLQYIQYSCHGMTNATLVAMSKNCPDLRVLRIWVKDGGMANHIPGKPLDEGIGAIVMNCKKITRLEARGLLTDRAFWDIGKYGKLLQSLSFNFNGDSDMGMKYVLEGCSKLQKLKIIDCPFGDSGLHGSSFLYYNMRFLLCMESGRVTRAGCAHIARLLLEKFGLEAHVMLYNVAPAPAPQSGRISVRYLRTDDGHIKIYVNRG